jgi:anhydro-N-acetylmuramic acid kinase
MGSSVTKIKAKYRVLGVMSGTSLDGLDLALVDIEKNHDQWNYAFIQTVEIPYTPSMSSKLAKAKDMSAADLNYLDFKLGELIGQKINEHIHYKESIDFVASHGHTIFHQPEKHISLQIGNADTISQITQLPVISDFRSADVAQGGQGAPLVPIGDHYLFGAYDQCLNLGGIANCSYQTNGLILAYDIMPFNMVFNLLALKKGLAFDQNGQISKSGKLITPLKNTLQLIPYYQQKTPKSLGYEDFASDWLPLIDTEEFQPEDLMHTYAQHAAEVISQQLNSLSDKQSRLLVTGGGTYHEYFISLLKNYYSGEVILPSKELIEFKEALVFAFLGVLKYRDEINCLASVTGAKTDISAGLKTGFHKNFIQT